MRCENDKEQEEKEHHEEQDARDSSVSYVQEVGVGSE